MSQTRRALSVMAAVLLVSGGCTSEPKAGPPSATPSAEPDDNQLPPVALPDLSRMEKSVQQQMTEQYQLLTSLIDKPATPRADLARAYGDMGNLLMAADYFEAA